MREKYISLVMKPYIRKDQNVKGFRTPDQTKGVLHSEQGQGCTEPCLLLAASSKVKMERNYKFRAQSRSMKDQGENFLKKDRINKGIVNTFEI